MRGQGREHEGSPEPGRPMIVASDGKVGREPKGETER